jgi:hypothetical protein
MSQRKKGAPVSLPPIAFGQGNIVLVCYGPVIISDRYAARMLATLRRKTKFTAPASSVGTPEGPDVPVGTGDSDIPE